MGIFNRFLAGRSLLVLALLLLSVAISSTALAQTTLSVNDVTQDEGNGGFTSFTFKVSLSAPAGASGVNFRWSTANGTTNPATAGSDYTAVTNQLGNISQGSSLTSITVQISGDTTAEADETFFVNISSVNGATVSDGQGLGTIVNDDFVLTPIYAIQGSGASSPLVGTGVTTTGIITAVKPGTDGGFFLQDPNGDGNPGTSDGIFVSTGSVIPGAVTVGNIIRLNGNVSEWVPASYPNQSSETRLSVNSLVVLSTGNPLPAPVFVTGSDTTSPSGIAGHPLDTLEEFEGMRVVLGSFSVMTPTEGTIDEPSATATSNGIFYGIVSGVARPFREPGIPISDPVPPPNPPNVPRFDENPERIRVESAALSGSVPLNVPSGAIISNLIGPLAYNAWTYTVFPDSAPNVTSAGFTSPAPAPTPLPQEFTVASANLQRFFDATDDAALTDPVLTAAAFARRCAKVSRVVRDVMRSPDIIAVQEVENLAALQAVVAKINSDAGTTNDYQAFLYEGNDPSGLDVGFLVRSSRVFVLSVTQSGKTDTYVNPNNGQAETLNDHPPLVLRARIGAQNFTVVASHLLPLSGIADSVDGPRVRAKRRAQAEFLANLVQARQTADPAERIVLAGDINAFRGNDGYVDIIQTLIGSPTAANQVVLASPDLVNPNLIDLVDIIPAIEQYSTSSGGNAEVLDHIFINLAAQPFTTRYAYARPNADQPLVDYNDPAIPDRAAERDQAIAFFTLPTSASDTDGDGMPNSYETTNGLNPNVNDAAQDLDGDGARNLDEYIAGTHANVAASVFRVTAITRSGGTVQLTWSSVAGKTYQVLGSTTLGGTETIVAPNLASQGNVTTTTTVNPNTSRFFRVETQ